ncbi:hypothetical protein BST19_26130 [Mycobacterium bouchedurhonense]|nr:hypothetical protein BST19_26130 [Mycobacterium bouchedurhonense]
MRVAGAMAAFLVSLLSTSVSAAAASTPALTPGSTLRMWDADDASSAVCTAGFVARNRRGTAVLLDAGHCDRGGDVTMRAGSGGRQVPVGGFVVTEYAGNDDKDTDIGVVRLSKDIPLHADIAGTIPVTGALPYVVPGQTLCKIGAVTGRSCGRVIDASPTKVKFAAAIAPGDSGGPVFGLKDDGTAVAVGITIRSTDDGLTVAELIGPWLQRWNLTID